MAFHKQLKFISSMMKRVTSGIGDRMSTLSNPNRKHLSKMTKQYRSPVP
ncbi:hypothetical protein ACFP3I_11455 [Chryseobacterium arachidis]